MGGVNSVHESPVFVVGTRMNVLYASGNSILLIYIYVYEWVDGDRYVKLVYDLC